MFLAGEAPRAQRVGQRSAPVRERRTPSGKTQQHRERTGGKAGGAGARDLRSRGGARASSLSFSLSARRLSRSERCCAPRSVGDRNRGVQTRERERESARARGKARPWRDGDAKSRLSEARKWESSRSLRRWAKRAGRTESALSGRSALGREKSIGRQESGRGLERGFHVSVASDGGARPVCRAAAGRRHRRHRRRRRLGGRTAHWPLAVGVASAPPTPARCTAVIDSWRTTADGAGSKR